MKQSRMLLATLLAAGTAFATDKHCEWNSFQ